MSGKVNKISWPQQDDMPEDINDVLIEHVYGEGKQAVEKGMRRCFNPYIPYSRALAAIWWNGWDEGEEIFYQQKENHPQARAVK